MDRAKLGTTGSRGRIFAAVSAGLLAFTLFSGCGDDQRAPTAPPSPPQQGSSPVTLTRLDLAGPTTVNLGQTAEFTVTGHYSDGTMRDVTSEANWLVNPGILPMSAPGRFTGAQKGETSVSVRLGARSAVIGAVIVVPAGTYKLSGTIKDEGIPVQAATVFIEDQALGRTNAVPINGEYRVYGVSGLTRITVTKEGYHTAVKDQTITGHQAVDFDLLLARPRDDAAGRYTVTFAAAPECTSLPEEARVRSYTGTITQAGPALNVVLEGGQFFATPQGRTHNRFEGTLEATTARFILTNTWFDYYQYFAVLPDVLEQLSPNRFFSVEGWALTPISSRGYSGAFSGSIGVHSSSFGSTAIARCTSANHVLSIVR